MTRTSLLLAAALSACGAPENDGEGRGSACGCRLPAARSAGSVTLEARTSFEDLDAGYLAAVASFEHASTDVERTNNDWDLLFGNDRHDDYDVFSVNTVTDDDSFIVDLGPIAFGDIPATVDPSQFPTGDYGEHDDVPVREGHVYYVRTHDENSRLVAVFGVQRHELNRSVELVWFRSSEPDRFVLEWR